MPAFLFLSAVALVSFFAFEEPKPLTQQPAPGVVVAIVRENISHGSDAWLRSGEKVAKDEEREIIQGEQEGHIAPVEAGGHAGEAISEVDTVQQENVGQGDTATAEKEDQVSSAEVSVQPEPQPAAPSPTSEPVEVIHEAEGIPPLTDSIPDPVLVLHEGGASTGEGEGTVTPPGVTEGDLVQQLKQAAENGG